MTDTAPDPFLQNQVTHRPGGRFELGVSGNPRGKPPGTRNRVTLAMQDLLDGDGERLTRKAIDLALGGDVVALRLCIERLVPVRRERPIEVELPTIKTPEDSARAMATIISAVAAGALTPGEGNHMASIIDGFRKTLEMTAFEARLRAVEEHMGKK